MFTGLVQSKAMLKTITEKGSGKEMTIQIDGPLFNDIQIGDSISISGVCSTATVLNKEDQIISVDYLEETLKKTTLGQAKIGDSLNIELCLTPTTKMGGHIVSGHVDEVGVIQSFDKDGEWGVLVIKFSPQNSPYLIPKGSISIDGISLTVVDITDDTFSVHLIPHTIENTTLKEKVVNDGVNLEFDQYAKYIYRFHQLQTK
mgnify:CR=1 FL=1|tara:strand:+ start:3063 stop:3668 length:606 start_codon:yes stop_codon:yes gene_type:complete